MTAATPSRPSELRITDTRFATVPDKPGQPSW